MATTFNNLFLEEARLEYNRLYAEKPGMASDFLKVLARTNGVNIKTLHKHLKLGKRKPREASITVQARHAEIDSYARMIWDCSMRHSFDLNKISVAVAFDHLKYEKRLPDWLTMKQVYASMTRLRLRNDSAVTWRKIAEKKAPMEMWQMDFSKSRYFKHRASDVGEIECVDPVTTKRQDDGVSLWFGVAVDMHSRVIYMQYFLSPGENAEAVIEFTLNAFDAKPGTFHLQGIPVCAYIDNGSGWKDGRTIEGLKKMRVTPIFGGKEKDVQGRELHKRNKQGRGQVEKSVNTLKNRLEALLFLRFGKGRKFTLRDLNEHVSTWLEEWNQGAHPVRRNESKMNIFLGHAGQQFEHLRYPTDDARALFSRAVMKKVIRRKILVAKDLYAFAPNFVDDGSEVEVIRDQTGYYLFQDGESHKLQLEQTYEETAKQERDTVKVVERKDAKLADLQLRKRFDEELLRVTGQTIGRMTDDEWNDVADFFEQPRSVAEIEEKVQWLRVASDAAKPARVAPARVAHPSNVIQLPIESYVGRNQIS